MAVTLTIAPDFQALCQTLTEEELRLLEESLIEEGCRDPIVVWKCGKQTIIVDGHNRYALCTKHHISYKLRYLEHETRQGAMGWAARNQLGRRNATEEHKSYLRGKLYRETKLPVGRPPNVTEADTDESEDQKLGHSAPISTASEIAAETGVDRKTLRRDEKFSVAVDALAEKSEPLKQAALRGDIPKSAAQALANAPKRVLNKLEKLEGSELRKAAKEAVEALKPKEDLGKCPVCAGTKWTTDDDGVTCSKCHHPHGEPAGDLDEKEIKARAKAQIKIWADTIGRWLTGPPSIDEYRKQFPGPKGDLVVKRASELCEALKNWQGAIK
jgi:hypothetical protein